MKNKQTKIFIVEDNPADMALIKESCKTINPQCAFITARDGQFAVDELEKLDKSDHASFPDFIILDLNLPRMDGHEVLEYIKSDLTLRMIPVIIFSSSSSPRDVQAALRGHANSFMVKPFLLEEFEKTIAQIYDYWVKLAVSYTK